MTASDHCELIALSTFGLEAVIGRELKQLGYEKTETQDGRISFNGPVQAICETNLWLRSADRVLLKMGEFRATDFDELFDQVAELPWEKWLPKNAEFPVRCKSVKSQLHSVPNCQAMVKKAIVKRLQKEYRLDWFPEDGPLFPVDVSIRNDVVTIAINTSGEGLHKRGYRKSVGPSPIKETLAAGLIQLSYWNNQRLLADPFCGTGTILIEAAWIGRNIAPGLNRTFHSERWPAFPRGIWQETRQKALAAQDHEIEMPRMLGYDIDERALGMARLHAREAGVEEDIHFQKQAFAQFSSTKQYGCLISNPPYGIRSGEEEDAERIYRQMGSVFQELETWSKYIITAYQSFEGVSGLKADRRRKLYNGNINCTYYQYQGPRPPRKDPSPDKRLSQGN